MRRNDSFCLHKSRHQRLNKLVCLCKWTRARQHWSYALLVITAAAAGLSCKLVVVSLKSGDLKVGGRQT